VTLVRFLHLVSVAFFVGGQLMLVAVVAPAIRRHGTDAAMRTVARRFGMGSGVALLVLVATGVAMASHFDRWGSSVLHAKLAVLVLVGVLLGVHVVRPRSRWLSLAMLVASLAIVWLRVELAHG
jgi:putative copper export protein